MTAVTKEAATLASFSAVDTEPGAAALIAALDEQACLPAIQRLRAAAAELLDVRPGHRVVEVGCGTGEVARSLAQLVGPTGAVLGIDASETMITEALRRTGPTALPVEFRTGEITALDLADASRDRTLCERVLQHVTSAQTAMAELVRVTRPGGRLVVIDTDWGLHTVHGADPTVTAAILEHWAGNAANGRIGGQLPALFSDAGVLDPTVVAETVTSTDPSQPLRPPFTTMAATAAREGAISSADADAWLEQLADAGHRGHFFWALTMLAVAGTRPVAPRPHQPTTQGATR